MMLTSESELLSAAFYLRESTMLKTELIPLFSMWMIFVCALKSGKLQDSDIYSRRFKGICHTPVCFPLPQNTDLNFLEGPRGLTAKVRSRRSCNAHRLRRNPLPPASTECKQKMRSGVYDVVCHLQLPGAPFTVRRENSTS